MIDATHPLLTRNTDKAASEEDGNPIFCQHLSDLNETQNVVLSEDIRDEDGTVLLKKGENLTERRAQMIVKHRLVKPIEQCIQLEKTYGPNQLFKFMKRMRASVPTLHKALNNEMFDAALKSMCSYYNKFPLLKQNITVLAIRLPAIYNNSVFTALAALAIARQMKLDQQEQRVVFMAALLHDCGFLYLPPHLANKTHNFSAEEWHCLMAHPIVAKRFLDSVPDLPKEVGNVVLDHHERTDGTGYPSQKFGDSLSRASQIIAIADDMVTAFHAYKQYGDYTHRMILSALKLNDKLHFEQVYKATATLFRNNKANDKPNCSAPEQASAPLLLERHKAMQPKFETMRTLARQLIAQTKHPLNRSIASMLGRLAMSIVRAGIMQEEHETWLTGVVESTSPEDLDQLLETSVMYDQVDAQLKHLNNLLSRVLDDMPADLQALRESSLNTLQSLHASTDAQ